jgi:hypothetical protein
LLPAGYGNNTQVLDANLTWPAQGQQEQKFFARFFSKKRFFPLPKY